MLVESGWQGSSETVLVTGGEALTPQLSNQLTPLCKYLINGYGPTEATVDIVYEKLSGPVEAVAIGKCLPHSKSYLVDADMKQVAPGELGELLLGGPQIALGYLNDPEKTAKAFIANPFPEKSSFPRLYRTGDLCKEIDGKIYFCGRIDDQVKIRGYRIELGEIESALENIPEIQMAVVVVKVLSDEEKHLVAYIKADEKDYSFTKIRDALLDSMPAYMVPSHFMLVDVFPQNTSGKVDKKALPAPQGQRQTLDMLFVEPKTDLEKTMAAIFARCVST